MLRFAVIATLLAACGAPIARNIPQPNKAVAAGITAGAAAAITIADPVAAQRQQEERKIVVEPRVQKVDESVPSDVLDRLENQQSTAAPPQIQPPQQQPPIQPQQQPIQPQQQP